MAAFFFVLRNKQMRVGVSADAFLTFIQCGGTPGVMRRASSDLILIKLPIEPLWFKSSPVYVRPWALPNIGRRR